MTYNIRNDEIESKLREIATKIGGEMPAGWGFTLLIFSYGENGNLFYISSANREDMVNTMKEFIQRNTQ